MANRGIVVGADGSPASAAAVRWATQEAGTRNLPLAVVTVLAPVVQAGGPWPEVAIPEDYLRRQQVEAQEILDKALRAVSDSAAEGLEVTGEVVRGPILAALVEMSRQAEMMVVGC